MVAIYRIGGGCGGRDRDDVGDGNDDDEDDDAEDDGDIYIMMKCLSVCLSRKMITSFKGL